MGMAGCEAGGAGTRAQGTTGSPRDTRQGMVLPQKPRGAVTWGSREQNQGRNMAEHQEGDSGLLLNLVCGFELVLFICKK